MQRAVDRGGVQLPVKTFASFRFVRSCSELPTENQKAPAAVMQTESGALALVRIAIAVNIFPSSQLPLTTDH